MRYLLKLSELQRVIKYIIPIFFLVSCIPFSEVKTEQVSEIELGKKLFFDSTLSRNFGVSCASCHHPELAFADSVAISEGFDGRHSFRNSPTLVNVFAQPYFMADGGVHALRMQPQAPIEDTAEMNFSVPQVIFRLQQLGEYKRLFNLVYKESPNESYLMQALEAFVASIQSENKYSEYVKLQDSSLFSAQEWEGFRVFRGKAKCAQCHSGNYLTDYQFYNLGIEDKYNDHGRYRISHELVDTFKFKTPTLFGVSKTAPYFHNGTVSNLDQAVDFVLHGKSLEIEKIELSTEERQALLTFLRCL